MCSRSASASELAALFTAVTELFGPEQGRLSAEDWLHVLEAMNGLPTSTREWRRVTVEVWARLAKRVKIQRDILVL